MISIVVPIFNQHEMTDDCILSIREHTDLDYELILVDNGSTPPVKMPFTGYTSVKLLRNETNSGFPKAVNQGIEASSGDIIILLNNDVVVTPGWADGLVSWFDEFDIVGPVTNYSVGLQRVQTPFYQSKEALENVADNWAEEYEGEVLEVNWIIGFCMAFKREVFDKIGAFDESLWPCSGEEIDFCFRAREAGYKIGIAGDVYLHHIGSQTFKIMDVDYEETCKRNDAHLAEKWGKDFWFNQLVEVPDEAA